MYTVFIAAFFMPDWMAAVLVVKLIFTAVWPFSNTAILVIMAALLAGKRIATFFSESIERILWAKLATAAIILPWLSSTPLVSILFSLVNLVSIFYIMLDNSYYITDHLGITFYSKNIIIYGLVTFLLLKLTMLLLILRSWVLLWVLLCVLLFPLILMRFWNLLLLWLWS